MTKLEVANVVGMITYQQELDLSALADTLAEREEVTNVKYEPTEANWLQTRFAPDESYVAFYRTGSCSVAGAQSIAHFHDVVERVDNVMSDLLDYEYDPEVEVSNIVATTDLGSPIPLETLILELGMERTEYEPEQFPALIYRGPNYVVLVFSSGKLLCTGLTDLDAVSKATDDIAERIRAVA